MSTDQNEPIDFGHLDMLGNLPGSEPAETPAPADDTAVSMVVEEPAEEEEEKEKPPGLLEKIATASPYTVILFLSLLAITVAVVLMGLELGAYGWDVKAKAFSGG